MDIRKAGLFRAVLALLLLMNVLLPNTLFGQYVPSLVDPMKKWSSINTRFQKIVFPREYGFNSQVIAGYVDTLSPFITRGMNPRITKFPILIHPYNILSNGMVTWAPKRMELTTMPTRDIFATQWLKQLTIHEYRHVVQMSTLNIGFTKALSYVIGELSPGLISGFVPGYFLEGDATYIETMFSTYGRGKQPNFSVEYRAIINEREAIFRKKRNNKLNVDKLLLGSYKDFVPDKYHTGYYLVSAANRYYGPDFWRKTVEYIARYPFTIVPAKIAFKKYGNTTTKKLILRTFEELRPLWQEASSVENTAKIINTKIDSYTKYSDPLPFNDSIIISLKKDMNRSTRFVATNINTGKEIVVKHVGYVTGRPIVKDKKIYWTEYSPSKSWGNKNTSIVRSMAIDFKKKGVKNGSVKSNKIHNKNIFYLTAVGSDQFAMVSYDDQNNPHILITDLNFKVKQDFKTEWIDCAFNGLTWDNKTGKLVAIVLNHEGMWLGDIDRTTGKFKKITQPSYVTINNLTASDGVLYFTSTSTGKDEVHSLDLISNKEHQLTTSKYGTVFSSLGSIWSHRTANKDMLLLTTYTSKGYMLSKQNIEKTNKEISYRYTPNDYLNIPWDSTQNEALKELPTINLDTINYTKDNYYQYTSKKYRKGGHLFKIHSWLPVYMNTTKLMEERKVGIGAGFNISSQNLLSTMTATATLGYYNKMFVAESEIAYKGLPVHISASIGYGGGYQEVNSTIPDVPIDKPEKYFSAGGTLSLPLNLSSGANNRFLTMATSLFHYNNRLITEGETRTGVQKMVFDVSYQSTKSTPAKLLAPRLGIYAKAYAVINPFISDFGTIYGIYGAGYLPGVMLDHALVVKGNIQFQSDGDFNFHQKVLFPRGAYNSFAAKNLYSASIIYEAPIFYPDWGFGGVLYFRRITLNGFGDYAHAVPSTNQAYIINRNYYSYGGGFAVDVNIFRFSIPIRLGMNFFKTNTYKGMITEFVFNIAL